MTSLLLLLLNVCYARYTAFCLRNINSCCKYLRIARYLMIATKHIEKINIHIIIRHCIYQIIITIIIGLNCPSDISDTNIRLSRFVAMQLQPWQPVMSDVIELNADSCISGICNNKTSHNVKHCTQ